MKIFILIILFCFMACFLIAGVYWWFHHKKLNNGTTYILIEDKSSSNSKKDTQPAPTPKNATEVEDLNNSIKSNVVSEKKNLDKSPQNDVEPLEEIEDVDDQDIKEQKQTPSKISESGK